MGQIEKQIQAGLQALAEADEHSVAAIISASADVALIIDHQGIVRDVGFTGDAEGLERSQGWLGQAWTDTVSVESRANVEDMLSEVREKGVSRPRQVSHPFDDGPDLLLAYTAVRLGPDGNVAVVGRDLRAISRLEHRLVEVQQALEREHWSMQQLETRYRLLFQLSAEAVMVVDANTMRVVEANPAATRLLGVNARGVIGKLFPLGLDGPGQRAATDYLAAIRTAGRADGARVTLSGGQGAMLSAALVRQDAATLFLVRLLPEDAGPGSTANARVAHLVESAPDAFVATDLEGRVLTANRAFLDLAQLATREQARGRSLGDWMGRPGANLDVLLTTLREHGVARLFATIVRGEYGSTADVELSAVAAPDGETPCIGITLREVGRRLATRPQGARDLTRAVEQLTGLVGRMSLRELVRDTADLVERHFIEAALELTHDNRTAAAEVLGVSRQSLYVKLRRYDLGGRPDPGEQ